MDRTAELTKENILDHIDDLVLQRLNRNVDQPSMLIINSATSMILELVLMRQMQQYEADGACKLHTFINSNGTKLNIIRTSDVNRNELIIV